MKITITCNVPDEWRDVSDDSGVLEGPHYDLSTALADAGAEDVEIRAED